MKTRDVIGPLALVLWAALSAPAAADEEKKGAEPTPGHAWKEKDLLEVEYRSKSNVTERGQAPGEEDTSISAVREVELVYIDRVDRIDHGRIAAITRHFKKARLLFNGEAEPLSLEGRGVTLSRDSAGIVQATWQGGSDRLRGRALQIVEQAPWPDLDRSWGSGLGTRKGELNDVTTDNWKPGPEVPSFAVTATEEFLLGTVRKGTWSLSVDGQLRPEGILAGKVSLEGRESEATEEGDYVNTVTHQLELRVVRRTPTIKTLPEPAAAPAAEESFEDEGPMEEDGPEPGEDEPMPDDDGDDPMPDDDGGDDPMPDDDDG